MPNLNSSGLIIEFGSKLSASQVSKLSSVRLNLCVSIFRVLFIKINGICDVIYKTLTLRFNLILFLSILTLIQFNKAVNKALEINKITYSKSILCSIENFSIYSQLTKLYYLLKVENFINKSN